MTSEKTNQARNSDGEFTILLEVLGIDDNSIGANNIYSFQLY